MSARGHPAGRHFGALSSFIKPEKWYVPPSKFVPTFRILCSKLLMEMSRIGHGTPMRQLERQEMARFKGTLGVGSLLRALH
jgi:hypothetical protein